MKIRLKRTLDKYYYIMLFSIFVFGSAIRKSFFSGALGTGNIVFLICELLILVNAVKAKKVFWQGWVPGIVLIAMILYIDHEASSDALSIARSVIYIILPSFLLEADVLSKIEAKEFLRTMIKILNFFVILIVCMMLADQLTGCAVTRGIAVLFSGVLSYLPSSYGFLQFRSISYLGHELYNMHFILMFYILNMLYSYELKETLVSKKALHAAAILGAVFTQSKMGVIVLFAAIIFFNYNSKKRWLNIFFLICGMGILYYVGLFHSIIGRFANTSLTTGRFRWLTYLTDYYGLNLKLFGGYGENLTSYFSSRLSSSHSENWVRVIVTAAFDSPIAIVAYQYGILPCILWLIQVFGSTAIKVFQSKSKAIVLCFALMFAQIMTFNQLIYNPDLMCSVIIWNVVFGMFCRAKAESCGKVSDASAVMK